MKEMMDSIKRMAQDAGRNSSEIEVIVRANIRETPDDLGANRMPFHGSRKQIAGDMAATRGLGVTEIFIDPTFSPAGDSLSSFISTMEQMRKIL